VNEQLEPAASQPPPAPSPTDPTAPSPPAAAEPPPPDDRGPAAGWGPGRTLAALAVMLVALFVEVGLIAAIFDPDLETLASRLVLQASLAATLVGVAFIAASPGGARLAAPAALGLRRPSGRFVRWSVLAYLGYLACALVIGVVVQPEQEDVTRELGVDEGVLGAIVAGVLIVAVAPLTEEVFFRGFMFAGMRRALPFVLAALIPSLIWGLFHYTGPESWGVVLQLTVFGLWLCWLYERTDSLWPPIALHAANNAIAFAILTG